MTPLFAVYVLTAAALQPRATFALERRPQLPRAAAAAAALESGPDSAGVPAPSKLTDVLSGAVGTSRSSGGTQEIFSGRTRRVLSRVLGYVWPKGDLRARLQISASMLCLIFAKLLKVTTPFALKRAVNALEASQTLSAATAARACYPLLVAYAASRLGVNLANEARTVAFASVLNNAARRFSLDLFSRFHELGADFHLANPTGGLSVSFARAVSGFRSLLFQLLYSIFPVLLEVGLTASVLTRSFGRVGGALSGVTVGTFVLYFCWTTYLVEWRIRLRRRLNNLDSAKGSYLVDSLVGQVKLFGNEAAEAQRFDTILAASAATSVRSALVGCTLNAGQALIFSLGLVTALLLAARGLFSGLLSLGDVVAVNTLLLQLGRPMEFIGYTVSEVRQSLADMDAMTQIWLPEGEGEAQASTAAATADAAAAAAAADAGHATDFSSAAAAAASLPIAPPEVRFEAVSYRYPNASAPALVEASFSAPAGGTTVLVGASGSGKSTALRPGGALRRPASWRRRASRPALPVAASGSGPLSSPEEPPSLCALLSAAGVHRRVRRSQPTRGPAGSSPASARPTAAGSCSGPAPTARRPAASTRAPCPPRRCARASASSRRSARAISRYLPQPLGGRRRPSGRTGVGMQSASDAECTAPRVLAPGRSRTSSTTLSSTTSASATSTRRPSAPRRRRRRRRSRRRWRRCPTATPRASASGARGCRAARSSA